MTYLTQATIDHATAAKRGLRDTYDWHQAVWKAFPGRDGEKPDDSNADGGPSPDEPR